MLPLGTLEVLSVLSFSAIFAFDERGHDRHLRVPDGRDTFFFCGTPFHPRPLGYRSSQ